MTDITLRSTYSVINISVSFTSQIFMPRFMTLLYLPSYAATVSKSSNFCIGKKFFKARFEMLRFQKS